MRSNNLWFVVFSFVIALVLSIVSLPAFVPVEFGFLRPHWVALVLIYWVIALPYRIGIVVAWMLGMSLWRNLLGLIRTQSAMKLSLIKAASLAFLSANP